MTLATPSLEMVVQTRWRAHSAPTITAGGAETTPSMRAIRTTLPYLKCPLVDAVTTLSTRSMGTQIISVAAKARTQSMQTSTTLFSELLWVHSPTPSQIASTSM